ncbi:MAG TPA: metalloregulator ArsR/SmtB family transcription factor [Pyrinomonadaceae bacterium]
MAKAKKRPMTPEALALVAARFKVLAEPLRLRILQALEGGEMSVGDITEAVESTQPNISKHLKMLQEAGVVSRRQEGNTVYYSIADETVFEICDVVCSSIRERLQAQAGVFA